MLAYWQKWWIEGGEKMKVVQNLLNLDWSSSCHKSLADGVYLLAFGNVCTPIQFLFFNKADRGNQIQK